MTILGVLHFILAGQLVSPVEPAHGYAFRCKAPEAQSVAVQGAWAAEPLPLTRDARGAWTGQTAPLDAGVYEYRFLADGKADPAPPGALHVPADGNPDYSSRVPHGDVHVLRYDSHALGKPRECWVYTPAGYSEASAPLPLLVLQHAGADTQKTWVAKGNVDWLLDGLIASGRAKPMIVLMLDGHPGGERVYTKPATREAAMEDLRRELLEDAIPQASARFKIDPSQTAIAGPSVGGGQALSIGLSELDRFGWIGAFSPGHAAPALYQAALADPAKTNARLHLLYITCATGDDHFAEDQALDGALTAAGVHHEWKPTEGAHQWVVWRRDLAEFLTRVFQPQTP